MQLLQFRYKLSSTGFNCKHIDMGQNRFKKIQFSEHFCLVVTLRRTSRHDDTEYLNRFPKRKLYLCLQKIHFNISRRIIALFSELVLDPTRRKSSQFFFFNESINFRRTHLSTMDLRITMKAAMGRGYQRS